MSIENSIRYFELLETCPWPCSLPSKDHYFNDKQKTLIEKELIPTIKQRTKKKLCVCLCVYAYLFVSREVHIHIFLFIFST